jgi:sulfur relay (sulfurtransferase) DsrC/TusE family protein/ribosomal protein S27AE
MTDYPKGYLEEICPHCGIQKGRGANNPKCDHLWYPENCEECRTRESKVETEKQPPHLDPEAQDRLKKHFMDPNGFMKQDWYYRDGGVKLFEEIVKILATEIENAKREERERVLRNLAEPRKREKSKEFTKAEIKVMDIIANYFDQFDKNPSLRTIAKIYGCTHHNIEKLIDSIIKKGTFPYFKDSPKTEWKCSKCGTGFEAEHLDGDGSQNYLCNQCFQVFLTQHATTKEQG